MRPRHTVLAALGRTAIEAAKHAGADPEELIRRARVPRGQLEALDGRIDSEALFRLWKQAAEASADPFFGLHAGERIVSAKTIHIVGYAARNSSTLRDCYGRTAEFGRLTNQGSEIKLRVHGDLAYMRVGPLPGLPMWPRCYSEMALAGYLVLGRKWTGVDFPSRGVAFQHPAPRDLSEYRRLFGENIACSARHNELILPAHVLDLPLAHSPDRDLGAYLDERAASMLTALSHDGGFGDLVRKQIDQELANGTPQVGAVARRMGMSVRTFQRRLADDGLVFSTLVDDVRCTVSLRLIHNPRLSLTEIAGFAGYRSLESFRSAFRRWTGGTPQRYRRTAKG
jgi:AraC-like DNA-binding protein